MLYQENIEFFLLSILKILGEMSPYLLLGFLFAGMLHSFVPKRKINKYFNRSPFKSSVLASLFGIPLPLCSCGVIPTGTAFYKNGASKSGTVSFLISTPQTGVDSILATFSLMGLPLAIFRPIAALITGILGGVITHQLTKEEQIEYAQSEQNEEIKKSFRQKIYSTFEYGFVEFIQDISKWLIIGIVLAALVSVLIPDDFLKILDLPPYMQMVSILIISIPLYICATGSIPLAMILITKGLSPGAAFVLLMAGPATNLATITVIGKVLGKKSLFSYLFSIIIGALFFGLVIDYAFPQEWFHYNLLTKSPQHHHLNGMKWWEIVSGILLVILIINGYLQKYFFKSLNQKKSEKMNTTTIKVNGMTCNHCKHNVETNLKKLNSVENATANLAEKSITLEGDNIDIQQAKELIDSLGYKTTS